MFELLVFAHYESHADTSREVFANPYLHHSIPFAYANDTDLFKPCTKLRSESSPCVPTPHCLPPFKITSPACQLHVKFRFTCTSIAITTFRVALTLYPSYNHCVYPSTIPHAPNHLVMSNTGPYYEPILFISPLLTIVPRTGASFDDLTGITGLPTDDRCTCGTYDALEFIDISSNYQIDLPDPLGSDGHNLTLIIAYDKPAFLSVTKNGKRDECPLCRILFYNFTRNIDQWLPQPILTGLEAKFEEFWSVHSASEAVKEIYSKIVPSHRTWVIGSFSNNAGTYKPQVVPDLCDLSRLKSWVQNCTTQHARCIDEKLVVDGLRLIDCYTQTVCEAEPSSCWVALSYVWGFREPSEPSECVPEDPERLSCAPKTVKDAMTVATVLGYRYLWVDAYCIDQVHGSNKEDQINQMDKIYRGAELTIVATGSDKASGLSGISAARKTSHKLFRLKERDILFTGPDPYKSARKSKWWSRGW